jgi:hypothetical protein
VAVGQNYDSCYFFPEQEPNNHAEREIDMNFAVAEVLYNSDNYSVDTNCDSQQVWS